MSEPDSLLAMRLKALIRDAGPITFRDFMAAALYDPEHGFYAKGSSVGSVDGAYLTSVMYPGFGFALSRAILRAEESIGEPLRVVEFGGGTGMLAETVQAWLPSSRSYTIVEPSPGLRARQRARGLRSLASPHELPPAPTIVLANEVLDALPVHRLMGTGHAQVSELYVALDDRQQFIDWPDHPSTPELLARLHEEQILLGRGQIAEVCLDLQPLLEGIARVITKGYVVFIDYGDEAKNLYGPTRRNGTLRAYWNQQEAYDWYSRVGDQDLTADVDYTALKTVARHIGLCFVGRMTQGAWLRFLGIEDYAKLRHPMLGPSSASRRLDEIVQLTHPARLGSAFDVLIFKTPDLPDSLLPDGFGLHSLRK